MRCLSFSRVLSIPFQALQSFVVNSSSVLCVAVNRPLGFLWRGKFLLSQRMQSNVCMVELPVLNIMFPFLALCVSSGPVPRADLYLLIAFLIEKFVIAVGIWSWLEHITSKKDMASH